MVKAPWRAVASMRLLALLAPALLIAGCSSGPDANPLPPATSAPAPWVPAPGPAVPTVTDTFHLLAWPDTTTAAPPQGEPVRLTIEPFLAQSASGRFDDTWRLTPDAPLGHLVGNATIWVEVTGDIVPNPNPLVNGCFWDFTLTIGSLDTGEFHPIGCAREANPVLPGIRRLDFPIDLRGVRVDAGETVHFELHTQDAARSPGAEARVLTASADHDSRIRLLGLELPIESVLARLATAA